MRRPEESNPRTVDPLGVILALLTFGSLGFVGQAAHLVFAAALGLIFIGVQATKNDRKAGEDVELVVPGALFLLSVLAVGLGMTTFAPGGGHPLWLLVAAHEGGAAVDLEADWIGLLSLFGSAFGFLAAARMGAKAQTARSASDVVIGLGAVFGLATLALQPLKFGQAGAFAPTPFTLDAEAVNAVLGVVLILSVERLLHARREGRVSARRTRNVLLARTRSIYLPIAGLGISALALAFLSLTTLIIVATMIGLLSAWTALAGGDQTRVPRRVLVWLTPTAAGLAILIAILIATASSTSPEAILSRTVHWNAFWASPWLGYGLNAQTAVARLFMTRLNVDALTAFPTPAAAYLVWLEQGGLLGAAPLIGCIAWITGRVLFASLRARRLEGLMRGLVCSSLFLGILALISAGPATFPVEAIWMLLLGLGFGAASLTR